MNSDDPRTFSGTAGDLHVRLNDAVAVAAAMDSVLRVIAEQSAEPEIRHVAEQALQGAHGRVSARHGF